MTLASWIPWALLVLGVTYTITTSFVFTLPRVLFARLGVVAAYFIYCPWCVSFWVGTATWWAYPYAGPWYFGVLLSAFSAVGLIVVLKGLHAEQAYEAEQTRGDD